MIACLRVVNRRFQLALCSREVEDVPGPGTRPEIELRETVVKHTVTLAQLQRWVSGVAKSAAERIRREKMREVLTTTGAVKHH